MPVKPYKALDRRTDKDNIEKFLNKYGYADELGEPVIAIIRFLEFIKKLQEGNKPIAKVSLVNNKVLLTKPNGDYFDIMKYQGAMLYTAPPDYEALVKENERLREALEVCKWDCYTGDVIEIAEQALAKDK